MGKTKVVLDTNVLVSALGFAGNEREIFRKCLRKEVLFYFSKELLNELERVLEYPKFKFTPDQKDSFKLILTEEGNIVSIPKALKIIKEDPSDNILLETAIVSGVDFVITGDKHVLKLK